jgi:hypothetical protein
MSKYILSNIDIRIRYPWCYSVFLSCYILVYPWYLTFCPYMVFCFVWAFSAVRGFLFCSNALPTSLNILSYPFSQQRGENLHSFCLEPSILCILTSGLNHYATILDIKHKYPFIPFQPTEGENLHCFGLEPSILCILTSGLNHYATILDIKHCFFVGI